MYGGICRGTCVGVSGSQGACPTAVFGEKAEEARMGTLLEYERARSTDTGAQTNDVLGGVGQPISPVDPVSGESKIKGLVGLVKSLVDTKLVLGCQVAVMQKGLVLADIAAGVRAAR